MIPNSLFEDFACVYILILRIFTSAPNYRPQPFRHIRNPVSNHWLRNPSPSSTLDNMIGLWRGWKPRCHHERFKKNKIYTKFKNTVDLRKTIDWLILLLNVELHIWKPKVGVTSGETEVPLISKNSQARGVQKNCNTLKLKNIVWI